MLVPKVGVAGQQARSTLSRTAEKILSPAARLTRDAAISSFWPTYCGSSDMVLKPGSARRYTRLGLSQPLAISPAMHGCDDASRVPAAMVRGSRCGSYEPRHPPDQKKPRAVPSLPLHQKPSSPSILLPAAVHAYTTPPDYSLISWLPQLPHCLLHTACRESLSRHRSSRRRPTLTRSSPVARLRHHIGSRSHHGSH